MMGCHSTAFCFERCQLLDWFRSLKEQVKHRLRLTPCLSYPIAGSVREATYTHREHQHGHRAESLNSREANPRDVVNFRDKDEGVVLDRMGLGDRKRCTWTHCNTLPSEGPRRNTLTW